MTNRSDNFNRADSASALGTPSDGGSDWTAYIGTWGIASNAGYNPSADAGSAAALEASAADGDVQCTFATLGGVPGVIARLSDSNNFLIWIQVVGSDEARMYKKVAGSFTQLGSSVSYVASAGDVFKFSLSGSTLNGYINGVLKLGPITETDLQTNTKHGLYQGTSDSSGRYDTFSFTGAGGGASVTYPQLERSGLRGAFRGMH